MPTKTTYSILAAILLVLQPWMACNNYDLAEKLEKPGSSGGTPLYVVSQNIPSTLSTGGTFLASVTFSRAVNLNALNISLTNGASISGLASPDNITWTFQITFASPGNHNLTLSGVADSTGFVMAPFGFDFVVNFA